MPVIPEYETLILKQSPTPDYEIIHVTRERFRIRISRLAFDQEYASKLTWLVESFDFVQSVRISFLSSSLIVNYDPDVPVTIVQSSLLKCIEKASVASVPAGIVPIKTESRPEIDWIERLGLSVVS